MYRRYEPSPQRSRQAAPKQDIKNQAHGTSNKGQAQGMSGGKNRSQVNMGESAQKPMSNNASRNSNGTKQKANAANPITRFIPPSLYNPTTRKVFGFMNAEDLFIAALIILLIDGSGDECDNTMLIIALLYLLLSEYIDLPV